MILLFPLRQVFYFTNSSQILFCLSTSPYISSPPPPKYIQAGVEKFLTWLRKELPFVENFIEELKKFEIMCQVVCIFCV